MSEEERKILEHLVEYLQDKIDTGYHKIFYNDDMYDEKTIDCINAINDILEKNKRLENIIKEVREYVEKDTRWFDSEYAKTYGQLCTCAGANDTRLEVLVNPSNLLKILDKGE